MGRGSADNQQAEGLRPQTPSPFAPHPMKRVYAGMPQGTRNDTGGASMRRRLALHYACGKLALVRPQRAEVMSDNAESTAMGAVSARKTRSPRDTLLKPASRARDSSAGLKPPSGPLKKSMSAEAPM